MSSSFQELLLWLLRRRWRVRVVDASMQPTFADGDELLVDRRAYRTDLPQSGDIIVFLHPTVPNFKLIKRVQSVSASGEIFVVGDNLSASTDSRTFGPISAEYLLGRVTSRF